MAGQQEQNSTDVDDDGNSNNKDKDPNPTPKNEESLNDGIEEDPSPFTVEGFFQHYGLWLALYESCKKACAEIQNNGCVQFQGAGQKEKKSSTSEKSTTDLAVEVPNMDSLRDNLSRIGYSSLSDIQVQDSMLAPALRAYIQLFGNIQQDLKSAQELLRNEDMKLQDSSKLNIKKELIRISKWALKLLEYFEKYLSEGRAAISNFPEPVICCQYDDKCGQTEKLESEIVELNRVIQKERKVELEKRVQKRDLSKYKDTLPYPRDFLTKSKCRDSIELNFEEGFIKSIPIVPQKLAKNDNQPNEVKVEEQEFELLSQICRKKSTDKVENNHIPWINEITEIIDSLTMIKSISTYELENGGSSSAPPSNDTLSPIRLNDETKSKKSESVEQIGENKSKDLIKYEDFVLKKEVKKSITSLKSEALSVLKVATDHDEQGEEANQMIKVINSLKEIEDDMVNDEEIELPMPIPTPLNDKMSYLEDDMVNDEEIELPMPMPIPTQLNDKMSSNLAIYFGAKSENLVKLDENEFQDLMVFGESSAEMKISSNESISRTAAELVKEASLSKLEEIQENPIQLPDLITSSHSQNLMAKISFLKYAANVEDEDPVKVNFNGSENIMTKTSISSKKSQENLNILDFQGIVSSIVNNAIESKKSESKVIVPAEKISSVQQEIGPNDSMHNITGEIECFEIPRKSSIKSNESKPKICCAKSISKVIVPTEKASKAQKEIDPNYSQHNITGEFAEVGAKSENLVKIEENKSQDLIAFESELPRKSSTKSNDSKPKICCANFNCQSQISTVQVQVVKTNTESENKTPKIENVQKLKKFIPKKNTFTNIFGIPPPTGYLAGETEISPKYDQNLNIRVEAPVTSKITEVREVPVEVLFRYEKSSKKTPATPPIPALDYRGGSSQKCPLPSKIPRLTSLPSKIPRPSSMPSKIPLPTGKIINKDNQSVQSQSRQSKLKTGNRPKSRIPLRKF